MTDLALTINVSEDGIGTFDWSGSVSAELLEQTLRAAAEDAFVDRGLRRLEVTLPAEDLIARRAVLRSGFRLEGIRRQAVERPDGSYSDVCLFARLASDQVHGPHGFSGVMNSALPKKRLIAHVLLRDRQGRVLLCETQFKPDWELPGGIVEPYETPRQGAIREVTEELGITLAVGRLLVVDWMPPYLGWDDAIEMIFDGGIVSEDDLAAWSLQPTEIKRVALVDLDTAAGLVTAIAHRRLVLAASLGPEEMAYTEDGRTP
ncbi:MAG TPA: NUDIX hydrolase [Propionibacteriaceae bacterium]|nr:NUDIX hydrolase [Propionibacteriaceae bacterium]